MRRLGQPFTALLVAAMLALLAGSVAAQERPNIVLVFMDNFGWGEPGFNGGGIIRGAATPRIDKLASEGLRLTNFNVEAQCTPSRSAILTGRYAIRSGNGTAPLGSGVYGLVQCGQIAHRGSHADRLAIQRPGITHNTAHGLYNEVKGRPIFLGSGLAVAGHRTGDNPRVNLFERVVINPETLKNARPKVVVHDI